MKRFSGWTASACSRCQSIGKRSVLESTMTGDFFATYIREHFNLTFANVCPKAVRRRLVPMGNDPSQTSRIAKLALKEIEGSFH